MRQFFYIALFLISYTTYGDSDDAIKKEIIAQSIASYKGNCPCPYSIMKNGKKCGKRSAYSKPRGASPICYPSDVKEEMIKNVKGKKI